MTTATAFRHPSAWPATAHTDKLPALLSTVIEDARARGMVWMTPPARAGLAPGLDWKGDAHITVIFADAAQARAWKYRWHRTWIQLPDRTAFLDYDLSWHDVQGTGVSLCTSDYPRAGYGGRRGAELRDLEEARVRLSVSRAMRRP